MRSKPTVQTSYAGVIPQILLGYINGHIYGRKATFTDYFTSIFPLQQLASYLFSEHVFEVGKRTTEAIERLPSPVPQWRDKMFVANRCGQILTMVYS